jgi:hypothetical protein
VPRRDVLQHSAAHRKPPVLCDWVNSFSGRVKDAMCIMDKVPQRVQRFELPRCLLDETRINITHAWIQLTFQNGKINSRKPFSSAHVSQGESTLQN